MNDGSGEDDEDRELEEGPAVDDDDIDNYELTSEDIELLRASQIESHGNPTGRTPLCCDGLDDAPTPGKIVAPSHTQCGSRTTRETTENAPSRTQCGSRAPPKPETKS